MICKVVITFFLCRVTFSYPQAIKIPEIRDAALPEEVNALVQHKQYPRSIGASATSYNNVEDTINEVENMIKANPTLPRLTRGEILDLIENITKADLATSKLSNGNRNMKERDPKAIMVVMPYTPNGNDNTMEELFTKPPVTHIIGAEPFKKPEEKSDFQKELKKQTNIFETSTKKPIFEKGNVPLKEFTSSTPTFLPTPIVSNEQLKYLEKKTPQRKRKFPQPTTEQQITSTEIPSTTHHSRQRRPIRRRPTTTEKHPNHRYPDEETTESVNGAIPPIGGITIIDAPKFSSDSINQDLFVQENQQKNVYVKKEQMLVKPSEKQVTANIPSEQTTTSSSLPHLSPQYLAGIPFDIKPEVTTKDIPPTTILPTTKSSLKEEEDKIRNMLASFGLLQTSSTTTTTSVPDVSNVADNLTPEMRDLLISFGLIPTPQEKPASASLVEESYNPVKAEVKPESYMSFKPLPEDYSSRQEMDELLAQFGLGNISRKRKSLPKKKEEQTLEFDAVPDQFKGVLEDIGLTDRGGRMIKSASLVKTQEKQHVFNPVDTHYASKEELEKLNKLLDVVKQLEKLNGTVTDEDLKKIDADNLKELISGLNEDNKIVPLDEQNAPNPVNYDHSLKKNEVKRQENSTPTTTTTTSTTTTTTESVTPNIKDLEDSFGGQVETTPVTEPPVPETTTRKTGFYYLVDWNTFLDIDDQKGKRVNLRFQPTIGDPKQFYSVTVP